jgi:hypothetical protein
MLSHCWSFTTMMLRSRIGGLLMGLSLVAALGLFPSQAQDPAKEKPTPARVSTVRRVPRYFGQIGLSPDQKAKIYDIREKHAVKLDELKKQLAEAQLKELVDCEAVLLDSQKKVLVQMRTDAQSKTTARTKAAAEKRAELEKKAEVKTDK